MTFSNLSIVFGPNLVWSRTEAASLAGVNTPLDAEHVLRRLQP